MNRRVFIVSLGSFVVAGCSDSKPAVPLPSATSTPEGSQPPAATATPVPRTATAMPTSLQGTPTPVATRRLEPFGFPLAEDTLTGLVVGDVGDRYIWWDKGPTVVAYSRDDQPSADSVRANRSGWNARTHLEYEGQPAVDWYVQPGRPVYATMAGTATLLINTVSNPFDVYGVSREPYIGNPVRPRAPISPFPGPGGGQGVFVRIENRRYRTDSAHLDIAKTIAIVPKTAFLPGYATSFDFAREFAPLRDFRIATAVASWEVGVGDVVGFTGDSGYSEAPHLHYAIRPAANENALCPTSEPGFTDSGWLFRTG